MQVKACIGSPLSPYSRLLIVVNWSVNWFACVQRITCISGRMSPSTERHSNPTLWIKSDKANKNWLAPRFISITANSEKRGRGARPQYFIWGYTHWEIFRYLTFSLFDVVHSPDTDSRF